MKFKMKALFVSAMMCALVAAGCNENEDPINPNPTAPAAPTNLMANSGNGTVNLKWTASTSASTAGFTGYELTVTPQGGTAMNPITIAANATSYTVTNLTNGTTYNFALRARNNATTSNTSTAATVTWAPAARWNNVRIYETASTTNGSGLNLSTGNVLTVANGGQWDLGLDTRQVGGVNSYDIGSPSLTSYSIASPRITLVSSKRYEGVTSLDAVFDTDALGSTTAGMRPTVPQLINFTTATQGFVFFAQTAEGNLAKILVKGNNGAVLQGTAPNRYVEMDISYQTVANVPYAGMRGTGVTEFKSAINTSAKKIVTE
ncbi:MAG TPA: fibronectin type III domain-containing protein [Patescibacteria group bacterium]|nr:fibronectin type III domain-containing protein [Patescibacteria group bacterium]